LVTAISKRVGSLSVVLFLVVGWLVAVAPPARSAVFTVTRFDDPAPSGCLAGDCSLREAIIDANNNAGHDSISLPAGTFTLTRPGADDVSLLGDLDITDPLTITGAGSARSTIEANGTVTGDRALHVVGNLTVDLVGFTVRGGDTQPANVGGGLYAPAIATLTIEDVVFTANKGDEGGGIWAGGASTLNLIDSEVIGNEATNVVNPQGGGIGAHGKVLIQRSTIADNRALNGGGINHTVTLPAHTLVIIDSVISGNRASDDAETQGTGGGVRTNAVTVIESSSITDNTAGLDGGGLWHIGDNTVDITDSTIESNDTGQFGGGVWLAGTGMFTLSGSTVADNTAGNDGGGIGLFAGPGTVDSSTISGNISGGLAGGIGGNADITLRNVTVSDNEAEGAGGVYANTNLSATHVTVAGNRATDNAGGVRVEGIAVLQATIIGGNAAPTGPDCLLGALVSGGWNIVGDDTDCGGFVLQVSDLWPGDPMLGSLQFNARPKTHLPLPGSPAIDAIPPGSCPLPVDAQGTSRPQGSGCDIGALEVTVGNQVGLVDSSQGMWHLRANGGALTSFFYGNPGDYPFMGDWDCDGIDTPGLYRQSDGFAYLRNSNSQGVADIRFFFGNPGDVPVVGDFNGDGCDTLSLYRPSTQEFFVINELGEDEGGLGAADFGFVFGNPGDKPVVGDWDGDGISEVGLHRESTGFFYWRDTLTQGIADGEIFFGDPGDRFVAGDWGIIDGVETPAVFRPANATFFFRHTLTQGNADSQFPFGSSPWLPVAGEFGL
jgi:hypothetical protein